MSIENEIRIWSNKRCPFNVSDKCITRDCAAWDITATRVEGGHYEYKEITKDISFFSELFSFSTGYSSEGWETYETEEGGGEYTTVTRHNVGEWDAIEKSEEWVKRWKKYKMRKWIPEKIISEGTGYCKRLI
jgi:hypothetical protein